MVRRSNRWIVFWVLFCGAVWLMAFILLAGCTYDSQGESGPEPLRVTFLDVGQGLSVLLEYEGRYALYDTGPDSMGIADSLMNRGIDSLDWVLVSHGHLDHAGGLMQMSSAIAAGKMQVGRILVGPDTMRGLVNDSVLAVAKHFEIPVDTLVRGDEVRLADGVNLNVLWPPEYGRYGENRASVVLKVALEEAPESSLLLTGDLDSVGERQLLELSPSISAELLQVAHHGSSGSNTLRFLSQVSPRYAAIGVGKNRYGHPTTEVLQKLKLITGNSAAVFRTDLHGSVVFEMWPGVGVVTR
jgi:competence protein ComEC